MIRRCCRPGRPLYVAPHRSSPMPVRIRHRRPYQHGLDDVSGEYEPAVTSMYDGATLGWHYCGGERPPFALEPGPGQERVWDYLRPPAVVASGRRVARAARSYPDAEGRFAAIVGCIAFYCDRLDCRVDVERAFAQPGGFYGGWVTPDVVGPFKGEPGTAGWWAGKPSRCRVSREGCARTRRYRYRFRAANPPV